LGEIREDETLNDVMVRAGHGFRTKKELLEDARKSEANESDAA
jgi:hypothetical protein